MANELIGAGLQAFTAGNLEDATRSWLLARRASPGDPRLSAYLQHVRALAPAVFAKVEAELGAVADPAPAATAAHPPKHLHPTTIPSPAPAPLTTRAAPAPASAPAPAPAPAPPPAPKPAAAETGFRPIGRSGASPAHRIDVLPTRRRTGAPSEPSALPELDLEAVADRAPAVRLPEPGLPPGRARAQPLEERRDTLVELPGAQDADPWGDPTAAAAVPHGSDSVLGMVGASHPRTPTQPKVSPSRLPELERRLDELFELNDFSGAIEVADQILGTDAGHREARKVRDSCAARLQAMYESKIGDRSAVPRVLKSPEELIWLDLDHRSGFVLAQIDGTSTYEDIVEVAGMDPLESYRIIAKLVQEGVIGPG